MKVLLIILIFSLIQPVVAKEEKRKCKMGRDYWLYTPDNLDKSKTYWLVVGVHGFRGKGAGAAGLANWINKLDDVIVIGPSFPSTGPYYQLLQGATDKQLINIHKKLSDEFKLHSKMFLYGFSGGAQYVHRFTSKHYKKVIGVSAHSGGTWDRAPSKGSVSVLWTVSCGLKDTSISTGANMSRIDFFRTFYKKMDKGKFTSKPFVTNMGHRRNKLVLQNTEECFRVATTGLFDYQREVTKGMSISERERYIREDKKLLEKEFKDGKNTYQLKVNKDGWTVESSALKSMRETRKLLDRMRK